jgi:hypothetical protein
MSRPAPNKLGATPGKLALIAVLALVLVGVIASNWPTAPEAPAEELQATRRLPTRPAAAANGQPNSNEPATPAGPFGEFAEDGHWPELPLRQVTSFDPLATAAWAKPAEATAEATVRTETQVNELLAAKEAIIFVSGDKQIARIGDKEFQVGDRLGRYLISEISPRGVVLSESE